MGNEEENNKEKEVSFFKSFIPQKISNETSINFFDFLRKTSQLNKNKFHDNLQKNLKIFENHKKIIKKNKGYIEDQYSYKDMFYGNKTLNYCGCGVIAVFNAMNDLKVKKEISLPLIINHFENDGIVLSGVFGTAPTAIKDFFVKEGFETISTTKEEEYDKIGQNYDSFIFTFYSNKNNIFEEVHIVNISKNNGKYSAHNNGYNSHLKLYNSISEFINKVNNGKSKGIFLIGIKKKTNL